MPADLWEQTDTECYGADTCIMRQQDWRIEVMETKMQKKDFSSLGLRMLIGAVLITAVQLISQGAVLGNKPEWADNFNIVLAVTMVPLYVIGYPVTFLIMKKSDAYRIEKHKLGAGKFILAFMMSYGLMILGNIIGLALTAGIGLLKGEPVDNALLSVITEGNVWISAIYTVLLAPVFEEILFRKLICDRIVQYGQRTAIIVSGLLFGLFHMNFNQFFYAAFLGGFFAFIYVKTGNLKYTIGLHMVVNFMGSVVGGLLLQNVDLMEVSGMAVYAVYSMFIYGIGITGLVLLLINRSKMKAEEGEIVIEKGNWFKTVILNPGMILYCGAMLVVMIVQAFVM